MELLLHLLIRIYMVTIVHCLIHCVYVTASAATCAQQCVLFYRSVSVCVSERSSRSPVFLHTRFLPVNSATHVSCLSLALQEVPLLPVTVHLKRAPVHCRSRLQLRVISKILLITRVTTIHTVRQLLQLLPLNIMNSDRI